MNATIPTTDDSLNPPDYAALWAAAALPDTERNTWREIMAHRTDFPDDAERLSEHGWTPDQVVQARTTLIADWSIAMDNIKDRIADRVVLADETSKFHESEARSARQLRNDCILVILHVGTDDARWTHASVGALVGLTRQRVRAIRLSDDFYDRMLQPPLSAVPTTLPPVPTALRTGDSERQ